MLSNPTKSAEDMRNCQVRGQLMYLYRAVDGQGNTVEFYLRRTCGIAAAKCRIPSSQAPMAETCLAQETPHKINFEGTENISGGGKP